MLIDLFVSLIPAMINVLMVAVPKIAMALGRAFMKVLSAMFTSLGKSNSFLEFVLKLVFFGIIIFKMVSVLAPLFSILGVALGLLLTPVGLLILAFVGLAYSFQQAYKRSQAVRDAVASMFSMLKEKAMGLWQSIKKLWDRITGAFTRIKEALFGKSEGEQDSFWVKTIEVLGDVIGGVIDGISWAIENVLGPVIDILADIIVIIIKLFKWLQPMFKWIYEAVMNQIRPAFRAIGEIFAGVAKFFKDLASASSFGDVAKIIGNAFLEAGVWLRNRLQDLFEGMINSLLRMIPKTLGGYSSAENKAQKDVAEFLNKKIGLSGAGENQAIDLIEAIREAKKGNVDFNKLQKTEDYSKLLGKDFDDLIRLAKNDAEKERLKGLIANLSQLDFKEDKGEALQQLGDAFDKVGDKIVASFDKKSGRVTNTQPYQEMKEIVRKK
jgi:phage-related protein